MFDSLRAICICHAYIPLAIFQDFLLTHIGILLLFPKFIFIFLCNAEVNPSLNCDNPQVHFLLYLYDLSLIFFDKRSTGVVPISPSPDAGGRRWGLRSRWNLLDLCNISYGRCEKWWDSEKKKGFIDRPSTE